MLATTLHPERDIPGHRCRQGKAVAYHPRVKFNTFSVLFDLGTEDTKHILTQKLKTPNTFSVSSDLRHTNDEDGTDGQGEALLVLQAGVQHAIPAAQPAMCEAVYQDAASTTHLTAPAAQRATTIAAPGKK